MAEASSAPAPAPAPTASVSLSVPAPVAPASSLPAVSSTHKLFGGMGDDFNCPMAKRSDTMFLQSYDSPKKIRAGRMCPTGLTTADIPGAQAGTGLAARTLRPKNTSTSLDISDIAGTSPSKLIPREVNRVNTYNLSNKDIDYSYANVSKFKSSRCVDPNVPQYKLPSTAHRPITPPPQYIESLKLDDIAGTKPHHKIVLTKPIRPIMKITDIEGAQAETTFEARLRKMGKDKPVDNPTVEFKRLQAGFKTNRTTYPLSPRYKWDSEMAKEPLGEITGAHPTKLRPERHPESVKLLSLKSHDIPGAQPCIKVPKPGLPRREYRKPGDVSDIYSAHPTRTHTTFHRTLDNKWSQRHTDPITPVYKPLGWRKKEDSSAPQASSSH